MAATIQMGNTTDEDGRPGFFLTLGGGAHRNFIPYTEAAFKTWVAAREEAEGVSTQRYAICDAVVDRLWYDGQHGLQRG